MKELITQHQADLLMWIVLVTAPILGLLWGIVAKRVKDGLIAGVLIGVGNLALWKIYNAITDKLGLDTVKNLFVNLALFVAVGLVVGLVWGWLVKTKADAPVSTTGVPPK